MFNLPQGINLKIMKHYTQHIGCNLLYNGTVYRLDGIQFLSNGKITLICYDISHDVFGIHLPAEDCKLILRPLSDLTNTIIIKDKEVTPYLWWDDKERIKDLTLCSQDVGYVEYLEYFIVELLLEWHFDVFGLIEKDLAVDINTLT